MAGREEGRPGGHDETRADAESRAGIESRPEPGREAGAGQGAEAGPRPEAEARSEADERVADLEGRWLRAVAELDTVRRRTAREMERQRLEERARVAAEWLPVLDNLELALRHAGDGARGAKGTTPGAAGAPANAGTGTGGAAHAEAVIEGVRAVRDQAVAVLARLGFPRQEAVGQRFDPALHEAVGAAPDPDAPPGTVIEVVRPGYGDADHLLRPAAVVVSTKAD
ncbi:nucleotide exchange factor GrpE [Microtetraspora niveoalba]|uniref:nucleotide exchange factor GrpE n=1 Tax=Microtetraspora niveoalba TaxID=46175 RepID=UPI000A04510D|nr:nucleotide exchange factor GrpE [Microtetraspora niveoalba]